MSLSDFARFTEWSYGTMIEVAQQQIDLFNRASRGTILLRNGSMTSGYDESAHYATIANLIKERDPFSQAVVAPSDLEHVLDGGVKIPKMAGPVNKNPAWFKWIKRSPNEAGVAIGRQLAVDKVKDMLNTAILCGRTAISSQADAVVDITGDASPILTPSNLLKGSRVFGDQAERIRAHIMHSTSRFDLFGDNLENMNRLFEYQGVAILSDILGAIFIVTDSPALVEVDGVAVGIDKYSILSLTEGAIQVTQNDDYTDNTETKNGQENIQSTWQAEWSYNCAVKGITFDKTNLQGENVANSAMLSAAANWQRSQTDVKNLAGVLLETRKAA